MSEHLWTRVFLWAGPLLTCESFVSWICFLLTQEFIIFDSRCQQTKYEDEEREKTAILKVVKNYLHVKPQKLIVGINFEAGATFDNSFFDNCFVKKRDLLTVEVSQFWIVEEKPVERSTCSPNNLVYLYLLRKKNLY